jgi:hypothetical protein
MLIERALPVDICPLGSAAGQAEGAVFTFNGELAVSDA